MIVLGLGCMCEGPPTTGMEGAIWLVLPNLSGWKGMELPPGATPSSTPDRTLGFGLVSRMSGMPYVIVLVLANAWWISSPRLQYHLLGCVESVNHEKYSCDGPAEWKPDPTGVLYVLGGSHSHTWREKLGIFRISCSWSPIVYEWKWEWVCPDCLILSPKGGGDVEGGSTTKGWERWGASPKSTITQ